jgi:hypothetical protein
MNTTTVTIFEVSNVKTATEPLPEVSYKEAVEALLTAYMPLADHGNYFKKRPGFPYNAPEHSTSQTVEACSRYHGRLLKRVWYHPLMAAAGCAFSAHRPLCLSPDMIWLTIIQGVANHINAHAEELRSRFVSHQGKTSLHVRRDDFIKGSPENPWSDVFHEFSEQIRDHVEAGIDLFVPNFSTTGPVERAAAEVVLLDAMQRYFKYSGSSLCGIPTIALEGTPEDWKGLAERAQGFRELGLEWWFDVLSPILDQFARAAQGDVDTTLWRSLYKYRSWSGGPKITGWITAFFPYCMDMSTGRTSVPSSVLFDGDQERQEIVFYLREHPPEMMPGWSITALPCGLSKAPFRWDYHNRAYDMEFFGGFVGVAQDQETLTLRPEIGWAVREAPAGR